MILESIAAVLVLVGVLLLAYARHRALKQDPGAFSDKRS